LTHDYEKAIAQYKKYWNFSQITDLAGRIWLCAVLYWAKRGGFKFMEAVAGNFGQ